LIGEKKETRKAGKSPLLIVLAVVLLAIVTLYALYALSQLNYLLFHSAVEIFGLAIAFAIFRVSWNSRRMVDNHYFLLIGIARALFEVTSPDSKHMVCSLEKPRQTRILGDITEIDHVCRNQKCKEQITIYSYTPVDYFSRV
jgi:hypothetical protein